MSVIKTFMIEDNVCIITGGAGLLGKKHAEAVLDAGGIPVLLDINREYLQTVAADLQQSYNKEIGFYVCDITNKAELEGIRDQIIARYGKIDALINNAANNPKVEAKGGLNWSQFEQFSLEIWNQDIAVGITGAFLCSQVFGSEMAHSGKGVILNVSSDLGIIAPDQRIYRKDGLADEEQNVKPVTYSVVKHGLLGLTKYLATYWAEKNIRVNAICPGGVYNGQDEAFLVKLTNLIPMGRMADCDEYKGLVLFMISEASSYMTGSVISADGGRTCW